MSGAHATSTMLRGLLSAYEVCNLISLSLACVLRIDLYPVLASTICSLVQIQGFFLYCLQWNVVCPLGF